MANFLLASQRLTRSGQGKRPYEYFESYLVTVTGFPSVALAMLGYYARYPAIYFAAESRHIVPVLDRYQGSPGQNRPSISIPVLGRSKRTRPSTGKTTWQKAQQTGQKPGSKSTHQSFSTTR
jgi:hypothetical protein